MRHFLGWVGGARRDLLREAPGDAARFSSMGAVLIGTSGMAALSSTFALTTAVKLPLAAAIVVGLLWGALILSLDRMLVLTMSRRTGRWAGLTTVAPRVALALLIGTIISVPLVLRIFQPELDNELQVMHSENLIANQKKLDQRFADITPLETKVAQLQRVAGGQETPEVSADPDVKAATADRDKARKDYDAAAAKAQCELNGTCGTKESGPGDAYQAAKKIADQTQKALNQAALRLKQVTDAATARIGGGASVARQAAAQELTKDVPALQARKAARDKAQRDLDAGEEGNTGLLVRLEALERLSEGHPTVWTAHLALMALFACIELLPVLAKLLSSGKDSLYESLAAQRDAQTLAAEDARAKERADRERRRAGLEKVRADEHLALEQGRVDEHLAVEQARAADRLALEQGRLAAHRALQQDRIDQQTEIGRRANGLLAEKQDEMARKAVDAWGQVAALRTDEELARWYEHYAAPYRPPAQSSPAHQNGTAAPVAGP